MTRLDALRAVYPQLENRIVVTIMGAVAAVFKDATVSGTEQVETLLLHDANGDRTEISFADVQYAGKASVAEQALFTAKSKP